MVGLRVDFSGLWWFSGGGGRAPEGSGWSSNGSMETVLKHDEQ
jgi:hypothetical protein